MKHLAGLQINLLEHLERKVARKDQDAAAIEKINQNVEDFYVWITNSVKNTFGQVTHSAFKHRLNEL